MIVLIGEKNKRLEYVDVQIMNACMFMSESNFKEDGFDSQLLMTMPDTLDESSCPLDLISTQIAQLNDDSLMSIMNNYIASSG